MSARSRTKGASGERELARLLANELGLTFRRNLTQYQARGQGDLIADEPGSPFLIEAKRYARGWTCAPSWEDQARAAAEATGLHPCIAYRFNGQHWRFRVRLDAIAAALGVPLEGGPHADLDLTGFAWLCRELMAASAITTRKESKP